MCRDLPAIRSLLIHERARTANYTMIWNGLDYVALVIPTGLAVDPELDRPRPLHQFHNESDKANYEFCEMIVYNYIQTIPC